MGGPDGGLPLQDPATPITGQGNNAFTTPADISVLMSTLFADPVPKTEADTTESDKTEGGAAAVKKTEGEKTEITTDAPHGRCNHRKDWKRLRAKKVRGLWSSGAAEGRCMGRMRRGKQGGHEAASEHAPLPPRESLRPPAPPPGMYYNGRTPQEEGGLPPPWTPPPPPPPSPSNV